MLIRGLSWLILFQLIGTALNVLFLPFLPSAIIGMVLLVVFLRFRGRVSDSIETASSGLLRFLPLLLTPPATGIMMYGSEIAADAAAILVSLTVSFILVVPLVGHLMQYLIKRQLRKEGV
ncbi:MAG: CidA/LrgA family protein [Pseudomonas sp.]